MFKSLFQGFQVKSRMDGVSLLMLVLLVAIVSAFYAPHARAFNLAANPPCYDIIGEGKAVPIDGINNSGIVQFDKTGANPQDQYEACVIDPDSNPDNGVELRGWAWDTNLGWISFYCPSGMGASNEGVSCAGAFTDGYGVKISKDGKFSGFAWSDNAGWISFDNSGDPAHTQVKLDTTTAACQGFIYADVLPDAACPVHTKKDTMAWSDSVGWIDFDGVTIPWYSVTKEIDDAPGSGSVVVTMTPDPSTLTKNTALYANGADAYTLKVHIQNKKGEPIEAGVAPHFYVIQRNPEWEDFVKKDQTNGDAPVSKCPSDYGAVEKPCDPLPSLLNGDYGGTIKSVAPTSNMNFWDENNDGVQNGNDFPYETITAPAGLASPTANTLKLKNLWISIYDTAAKACAYGDPQTCAPISKLPNYADAAKSDLKFRPKTEVTKLQSPPDNNKFIDISSGPVLAFPKEIVGNDKVTFYSGIDPVPADTNFDFMFDLVPDGVLKFGMDGNTFVQNGPNADPLKVGVAVKKDDKGNPISAPPQYIPGEYIYSIVEDLVNGVKYYSNKLPKVTGSIAVQPVVVLRGNVYSSGATASTTFQAVRSLGDVSTNILRDTIFRNVSKIIAGTNKNVIPATATLSGDVSGGFKAVAGEVIPLLKDDLGVPKVYLHYGDLVLGSLAGNATDITWKGERTIIVIGGSVKLNANLVATPPMVGEIKPKLGIIVLKDLAAAMGQDLQGHLYIGQTVSHIQANIFADGTVFSANKMWTTDPVTGEPSFASIPEMEGQLKHYQLLIDGSIASQNTVGGSLKSVTGIGAVAADDLHARFYDLNFLRNYTGFIERNMGGNAICPLGVDANDPAAYVRPDGTPNTVDDVMPQGCLHSPAIQDPANYVSVFTTDAEKKHNLGATYIYFDPPSPTLPGFGAALGGTQKQLTQ